MGPRRQRGPADEAQRRLDADEQLDAGWAAPDKERDQKAAAVADAGRLKGWQNGQRRWYYAAPDGTVPCVDLSETAGRQVEQGRAALVVAPDGRRWIVDQATAAQLRSLVPGWVRVWIGEAYVAG